LSDKDVDKSILQLNDILDTIDKNGLYLTINNPNPLQFTDKFFRFIDSINLSKVKNV
jgi:hypothetical protein